MRVPLFGDRSEPESLPLTGNRPDRRHDLALSEAIARGEYLFNGFRNRDLAHKICPAPPSSPAERKKRSARITYQLRILRGHGVIQWVAGTHRDHVTAKGRQLIAAVLAANAASLSRLEQCA